MDNANSPEYLEKIKIAVIENLKKTVPVPSVQMQDVPRHGLNVMTDEDDAELDDEDADNNPDVRMTQRAFEKRTAVENEFEDSDDEDMAEANGVYQANGKRKLMTDFKNPHEHPEPDFNQFLQEKEAATSPQAEVEEAPNNDDETMEDIEDEVIEEAEPEEEVSEAEAEAATVPPVTESTEIVDQDGDVDMGDAAEPEEAASIKQEDADTQPTSTQPALAAATEQEPEKSTEELVTDDIAAEAAALEQVEGVAQASNAPASEPKEVGPDSERANSPAKQTEPAQEVGSSKAVEGLSNADEAGESNAGVSGPTNSKD